jgi:hypothetical protein
MLAASCGEMAAHRDQSLKMVSRRVRGKPLGEIVKILVSSVLLSF